MVREEQLVGHMLSRCALSVYDSVFVCMSHSVGVFLKCV